MHRMLLLSGFGIGGPLPANSTLAQTDCIIPVDQDGTVHVAELADTLSDCADQRPTDIWYEIVDRGLYELAYSVPEDAADRQITGISHVDWAQTIPLELGTVFGFRATAVTGDEALGETIEIITYLPDGPSGPRASEIRSKPVTPDALEAVLFLIGSERFLIPGEWRIELRHRGRILAAQRFMLVAGGSR